jgi:hypothetical protein
MKIPVSPDCTQHPNETHIISSSSTRCRRCPLFVLRFVSVTTGFSHHGMSPASYRERERDNEAHRNTKKKNIARQTRRAKGVHSLKQYT